MPNSNSKGDRTERELVNYLDNQGWAVLRAPASGSGRDSELPDVLAGNGETFYAMEVKASGGDRFYIDRREVDALEFFANSFGAKARLAVKFDVKNSHPAWGEDWPGHFIISSNDLELTDSKKSYRVDKDSLHENGRPISDLSDAEIWSTNDSSDVDAMDVSEFTSWES